MSRQLVNNWRFISPPKPISTHIWSLASVYVWTYVSLEHRTSLKSLEYICSNSQKYIVWVKIIYFMPKIISILNKDHIPWRYFVI